MRNPLTLVLALLFLVSATSATSATSASEVLVPWWGSPLVAPMAAGVEIRVVPSVPKVKGMPLIEASAPSPYVTPRVAPIVDPPPRIEVRPVYVPRSLRPRAYQRRPSGTGGWTR